MKTIIFTAWIVFFKFTYQLKALARFFPFNDGFCETIFCKC